MKCEEINGTLKLDTLDARIIVESLRQYQKGFLENEKEIKAQMLVLDKITGKNYGVQVQKDMKKKLKQLIVIFEQIYNEKVDDIM